MRPILIRIFLDQPWTLWATDPVSGISGPGACIIIAVLMALYFAIVKLTWKSIPEDDKPILKVVGGVAVALTALSLLNIRLLPPSVPLFGYGVTVLVGVLTALWITRRRAIRVGIDPELVIDLALWLVVGGVMGGRIAYLVQFRGQVFDPRMSIFQALFAIVNLTAGGLVFIGSLFGGFLGIVAFCLYRKQSILKIADLVMPSVFVGVIFGRIGCLLNGCCFGDPTALPWGITFPHDSLPFKDFVARGLLDRNAVCTMPLHPTQIYLSLDGLFQAIVLSWFYWRRRRDGEVLALSCMTYATTRFLMEFLRGDSPGVFGTPLTISQVYSIGLFLGGIGLWVALTLKMPASAPPTSQAPQLTT
jgi:phosphatidylglycerol:prolipoprotein diacylglycerol transferase